MSCLRFKACGASGQGWEGRGGWGRSFTSNVVPRPFLGIQAVVPGN